MGALAFPGYAGSVTIVGAYDSVIYPSRYLRGSAHIQGRGPRGGLTTLCGRRYSYTWFDRVITFPLPEAAPGMDLPRREVWALKAWEYACDECKTKLFGGLA